MGAMRVVAACLHKTRYIFKLLIFVTVAMLGTALVFYLKVEDRADYLGRLHSPHHFGHNLGPVEEFIPGLHLKGKPYSQQNYCNYTFR
jgi:hypothetical protein